MDPQKLKFEELDNLEYGSMVIIDDPLFQIAEEAPVLPYVLMCKHDGSFDFISAMGSSLMIKEQETIDAFNVRLIDSDSEYWNSSLSEYGKQMGDAFDQMKATFDGE